MSDDLGAWEQTKTRSKSYNVVLTEIGNAKKVTKVKDHSYGAYQVCRRPFINKSDRSLKKTTVNIILPNGEHFNLIFVRYYFEGPEHAIKVAPHGNSSNSSVPYLRTYQSQVKKLKESVTKGKGVKKTSSMILNTKLGDCKIVSQKVHYLQSVTYWFGTGTPN